VAPILEAVRSQGDAAVKAYTSKFDRVELDAVCVPIASLPAPILPADVTAAFDVAYANIRAFHEAQRTTTLEVETMPGVRCRRVTRPIGARGRQLLARCCCAPLRAAGRCRPLRAAGRPLTSLFAPLSLLPGPPNPSRQAPSACTCRAAPPCCPPAR
jgi:histidinol dehydrogenase